MKSDGDDQEISSYLEAVSLDSLRNMEAINALGALVDLAGDKRSTRGLDTAMTWAHRIEQRCLSLNEKLTLDLFKGNAWLEKYRLALAAGRDAHDWVQPELEQAVLSHRRVIANPGFQSWESLRRAQLYTNRTR